MTPSAAAARFRAEAARRILLCDGAFGTMIQGYGLKEADYRGTLDLTDEQKGNNDMLALTSPHVVDEITRAYLVAGSDVVATNTFNANTDQPGGLRRRPPGARPEPRLPLASRAPPPTIIPRRPPTAKPALRGRSGRADQQDAVAVA